MKNSTNTEAPLSPNSPSHPGPLDPKSASAPVSTSRSNSGNNSEFEKDYNKSHKRNSGNQRGGFNNRSPSTHVDPSADVKPYLAAPFQSDPAIYNAAAAAALAAQALAPPPLERTSPAASSTPLQQFISPPPVSRPPYYYAPTVMYFPPGQTYPATPNQDASAFFNQVTSPVAAYDPAVFPQWSYTPAQHANFNATNVRPPPILTHAPGRHHKRGSFAKNNNSFFPQPPPQQSPVMVQQQPGRTVDPRSFGPPHAHANQNNNNVNRNLSDGSTISNSSSYGRAAAEFMDAPANMNPYAGTRGGVFSPNQGRVMGHMGNSGTVSGGNGGSAGCTTNLYIRGLPSNATDESLYELCKGYGRIYSSKAILDLITLECKGFGFVMYEAEEETRLAFDSLVTMGYQVSYARTDPRSPGKDTFVNRLKSLHDDQSTNIYVSNLPPLMDEDGLVTLLKPRPVVSAKILRDPMTLKSRGVGFARLETRDDAMSAIHELHGKLIPDSFQHLQARFADSAAQKRFKISTQVLYGNNAGFPMSPSMMSPGVVGPYSPDQEGVEGEGDAGVSPVGDASVAAEGPNVYYDGSTPGTGGQYVYSNGMYFNHHNQQMYYGPQYYPAPAVQYGIQSKTDPDGQAPLLSPAMSDETVNEQEKRLSDQLKAVEL
ncbi:hypothetical protein HDU98_006252 [Podochytrium sp. JEL0797]|nr:hypothetical protein HDU98_006252 [Podochytrium sp. JEL0797]